jgi:hypothetical protein
MKACDDGSEGCPAVIKLILSVPEIEIDRVESEGETALSLAKAPKWGWEEGERYQRSFSFVPLLEEKARQQAIDAAAK